MTSRAADWSPWWLVVLIGAICLAAEIVGGREVPESRALEVSGCAMGVVCALVLLGPAPAIVIAAVAVGVESVLRRKEWAVVLMNVSNYGTFAFVGGLVATGLLRAHEATMRTAVAVVVVYLLCDVVSWALAVATRRLMLSRTQSVRDYAAQFVAVAPATLAGGVLTSLAVMTYETAGGVALGLLAAALLMIQSLHGRLMAVEFDLRAERDRAQAYLDSAGSLFVILDEEGRIVTVNRRAQSLLGRGEDELVGEGWQQVVPAIDAAHFADALVSAGATPGHVESRLRTAGDDHCDVLWSIVELPSSSGARHVLLSGEDITERREAERLLEQLAFEDPLTRMPNRRAFEAALEVGCRRSAPMAVLFIDLDGFKAVNDRFGHGAGDELLCHAARRLQGTMRDADVVARHAGDEFLVLLGELPGEPEEAEAVVDDVVDRVTHALHLPYGLQAGSARIGASVGVALHPRDGVDPESLISAADRQMYAHKHRTRV